MKNKIVAICGTYKRSNLIPNVLAQWERQVVSSDFEKYLLIYDDAGEFSHIKGEDWEIRSVQKRIPTLGAKWDKMAKIAFDELGATHVAIWDDDDVYGPMYIMNHMKTFSLYPDCDVSAPGQGTKFYIIFADRTELCTSGPIGLLHACWAFTGSFYNRCGGYNVKDIRGFDTNFFYKTRHYNWQKTVGEGIVFGYCWFSTEYKNTSPYPEECPMKVADQTEKLKSIITEVIPKMSVRTEVVWKDNGWLG